MGGHRARTGGRVHPHFSLPVQANWSKLAEYHFWFVPSRRDDMTNLQIPNEPHPLAVPWVSVLKCPSGYFYLIQSMYLPDVWVLLRVLGVEISKYKGHLGYKRFRFCTFLLSHEISALYVTISSIEDNPHKQYRCPFGVTINCIFLISWHCRGKSLVAQWQAIHIWVAINRCDIILKTAAVLVNLPIEEHIPLIASSLFQPGGSNKRHCYRIYSFDVFELCLFCLASRT